MSMSATTSPLPHVAEYADLPLTAEEVAACTALLDELLAVIRAAPNDALAAIEPATIFRHATPAPSAAAPQAASPTTAPAPEAAVSDLAYMTMADASALLRAKQLSPVELTTAVLARIDRVNPQVQAYVTILHDQALAAARQAAAEIAAGRWRGPLHGIPLVLKDLIETRGILTTASSKVLPDYVPENQAAVAKKLDDAGAVLLGKSHTHEFAYGVVTPPTRNPYNLECIPGGSSGGSAAAVASGMATIAIGTDTGGSIRIPAALSGTVGLKPTYGRVSRRGILSLSWSLDHAGPMTRGVEDAALMLQAIAGYDPRDGASAPVPVPDYTAALKSGVKGLKVGVCKGPYFAVVQPAVQDAVTEAVAALRTLGAQVQDVALPHLDEVNAIEALIYLAEASSYHQTWLRARGSLYNADVRALLQAGELVLATDYLQAQRRRTAFTNGVLDVLNEVDLLVLPTEPFTAPRIGQTDARLPNSTEGVLSAAIRFTQPFNLSGLPALSVPCGFAGGLPIGLQIVGRPFDEATVLQAGHAYEQATAWHKQRPPV